MDLFDLLFILSMLGILAVTLKAMFRHVRKR
jgi:hypothetical protein